MSTASQREATVQASWTRNVVDAAVRAGLARAALLAEAGFDAGELEDLSARIPYWRHARVWRAMEALGAPEDFGLRLAAATDGASALDLTGFIVRHCSTLAEAIEKLGAYGPLINEAVGERSLTLERSVAVWSAGGVLGTQLHRFSIEHSFAMYVLLTRQWLEQPLPLRAVMFAHAAPGDATLHRAVFGLEVQFGGPRHEIRFDAAALAFRLKGSEPQLRAHLEPRAQQLVEALDRGPFLQRLREVVRAGLVDGHADVNSACRALGLSARSFQRRLQELGTTFQRVLDEERRLSALLALDKPSLSIKQCAQQAGFASSAAFTRAFRRWTKQTPQQYRDGR